MTRLRSWGAKIVDLFISRMCVALSLTSMSVNVVPNKCAYEDAVPVHNQSPSVGLFRPPTCRNCNGGFYHSEATRKVGPRYLW